MLPKLLIVTFLLASLATCLVATAADCPGGSCSAARGARFERVRAVERGVRFERIRAVERGAVKKTRAVARWVVRGR